MFCTCYYISELVKFISFLFLGEYFCDVCCVSFAFKSKFERHLQSSKHKQRALISSCDFEEDVYSDYGLTEHPSVSSPIAGDETLSHMSEVIL